MPVHPNSAERRPRDAACPQPAAEPFPRSWPAHHRETDEDHAPTRHRETDSAAQTDEDHAPTRHRETDSAAQTDEDHAPTRHRETDSAAQIAGGHPARSATQDACRPPLNRDATDQHLDLATHDRSDRPATEPVLNHGLRARPCGALAPTRVGVHQKRHVREAEHRSPTDGREHSARSDEHVDHRMRRFGLSMAVDRSGPAHVGRPAHARRLPATETAEPAHHDREPQHAPVAQPGWSRSCPPGSALPTSELLRFAELA